MIGDVPILSVFGQPQPTTGRCRPSGWTGSRRTGRTLEQHASGLLDAARISTSVALRRAEPRQDAALPARTSTGRRKELRPRTTGPGRWSASTLDGTTFVEHIAYNAKGQRIADRLRQRRDDPLRLRPADLPPGAAAHRALHEDPDGRCRTYRPTGAPLQDFGYDYDLAGNITGDPRPHAGQRHPEHPAAAWTRSTGASPTTRSTACSRPPAASVTCRRRDPPWTDSHRAAST